MISTKVSRRRAIRAYDRRGRQEHTGRSIGLYGFAGPFRTRDFLRFCGGGSVRPHVHVGCERASAVSAGHHSAWAVSSVQRGVPRLRGPLRDRDSDRSSRSPLPPGTEVNVDGQGPRGGDLHDERHPEARGRASRSRSRPGQTHYVRCVPPDMPSLDVPTVTGNRRRSGTRLGPWHERTSNPSRPGSLLTPCSSTKTGCPCGGQSARRRPLSRCSKTAISALFTGTSGEEYRLDGSFVRSIQPVGAGTDPHELPAAAERQLPHYHAEVVVWAQLLQSHERTDRGQRRSGDPARRHSCVDVVGLRPHPLSEVSPAWCDATDMANRLDPYHINSLEPDGNDVVMSFRHLDAVYSVSKTDGTVEWKLGGVARAESLTVLNDPVAATGDTFRGQHDARILSDGTLDGSRQRFPPASLNDRHGRFGMPSTSMRRPPPSSSRRTILGQSPHQLCCGSARKLPGGNWLMSWGSTRRHHRAESVRQQGLQADFRRRLVLVPVPPRAIWHDSAARHCAPAWTRSSRAATRGPRRQAWGNRCRCRSCRRSSRACHPTAPTGRRSRRLRAALPLWHPTS